MMTSFMDSFLPEVGLKLYPPSEERHLDVDIPLLLLTELTLYSFLNIQLLDMVIFVLR